MDQRAQHRAPAHRQSGPTQADHARVQRLNVGGVEGEAHFDRSRVGLHGKNLTLRRDALTTANVPRLSAIFQTLSEESVTVGWGRIRHTPSGASGCKPSNLPAAGGMAADYPPGQRHPANSTDSVGRIRRRKTLDAIERIGPERPTTLGRSSRRELRNPNQRFGRLDSPLAFLTGSLGFMLSSSRVVVEQWRSGTVPTDVRGGVFCDE